MANFITGETYRPFLTILIRYRLVMSFTETYDGPSSREQLMSSDRSPLLAQSFQDLPPAVLLVAGKDPVRDDGILYAKLLGEHNGEDAVRIHM
jgi:acetyl esterase/lipase